MKLYARINIFTQGLSFMTLKSDAKFEEKLTCGLENEIRNLAKFCWSTRTSQNWWNPFIESRKCKSLRLTEELRIMTRKHDPKFEGILELNEEFDEFWPEHSNVTKICTLMDSIWPKFFFYYFLFFSILNIYTVT